MRALATALAIELDRKPVPLLVLRLPHFERTAWQKGKRAALRLERDAAAAFERCARASLRADDLLAHDAGSDVFAAAIVAEPREGRQAVPSALDCRAALERMAAGMSLATGSEVETGWTVVRRGDGDTGLQAHVAAALERGLRERERYEFFAVVGHELRSPLSAARGYLETVLEGRLDAAASRRFLETALRETLRLGRLVDNMFEFSLLDLSAVALESAGCDVRDTVAHACEILSPLAGARGVRICNDVRTRCRLKIDGDACLQLLVNLIDNAVKYGREGGTVRVSAHTTAPFARIDVEDDGPGIAAREREAIFGLRVRSSRAARPGTGIGLAIVRMIAERAGGEVRVAESALGGARFELALPLEAEFAPAAS